MDSTTSSTQYHHYEPCPPYNCEREALEFHAPAVFDPACIQAAVPNARGCLGQRRPCRWYYSTPGSEQALSTASNANESKVVVELNATAFVGLALLGGAILLGLFILLRDKWKSQLSYAESNTTFVPPQSQRHLLREFASPVAEKQQDDTPLESI